MRIIEDINMVERVLMKHPRKKKNKRWNKKYMKKYSTMQPRRDYLVSRLYGTVVCHPIAAIELRRLSTEAR